MARESGRRVREIPRDEDVSRGKPLRPAGANVTHHPTAFGVAVETGDPLVSADESLAELSLLAETAGLRLVQTLVQRRSRPHPVSYLGPGKLQELAGRIKESKAAYCLVDGEVTPLQHRMLEGSLDCKVVDRTQLILDIFAQHAKSREGKLQIELAQLQFLLPRLKGKGVDLSRLGGGIGARGPGEMKLEERRRYIRDRISLLQQQVKKLKAHRNRQRQGRQETKRPLGALVGYTNAGKSTLLNALTGARLHAQDKLFATLDPATRGARLPSGMRVYLTDTVGFIRKLPHSLVAAFQATLEEVTKADFLLVVQDVSDPRVAMQLSVVEKVLRELDAWDKPKVFAFNKMDRLEGPIPPETRLYGSKVFISAQQRVGLDRLIAELDQVVAPWRVERVFRLPADRADLVGFLQGEGKVLDVRNRNGMLEVRAVLHRSLVPLVEGRL